MTWGRRADGAIAFYANGTLAGVIPRDRLPQLILDAARELQAVRVANDQSNMEGLHD